MGLGMLIFWGLIVVGGVALVRYLASSRTEETKAEQILADRFARGEIDEDEYQRRRESLRASR
jgi:putative membrane protein